jgi:hypothetical protein
MFFHSSFLWMRCSWLANEPSSEAELQGFFSFCSSLTGYEKNKNEWERKNRVDDMHERRCTACMCMYAYVRFPPFLQSLSNADVFGVPQSTALSSLFSPYYANCEEEKTGRSSTFILPLLLFLFLSLWFGRVSCPCGFCFLPWALVGKLGGNKVSGCLTDSALLTHHVLQTRTS